MLPILFKKLGTRPQPKDEDMEVELPSAEQDPPWDRMGYLLEVSFRPEDDVDWREMTQS